MRLFPLLATLSACALSLACSGAPPEDEGPDYEVAPPKTPTEREGEETEPPPSPTETLPPAGPKAYRGTLALTDKVPFGGEPYCTYEIALSDVSVEVTVGDGGEATAATVGDVTNEATTGDCPHPPAPQTTQEFTLKTASTTASGTHLEFEGAEANSPKTTLVVDLTASASGAYDATLQWKRVDQPAPLDWTVTAVVPLVAE
jgi:hypothetical protein